MRKHDRKRSIDKIVLSLCAVLITFMSISSNSFSSTFISDYAEFDDVRLHYVTTEQSPDPETEEKTLILFLHGFPLFWYSWRNQLEAFGEDYLAVAMDGRGYNLSSKPDNVSDYTLDKLVEDVRQMAAHLVGDKKFILVGHDWGGGVAWAFAQAHPDKLHSLVVENAPPFNLLLSLLQTHEEQRKASTYMERIKSQQGMDALVADDFAVMVGFFDRQVDQGIVSAADIAMYKKAWGQPGAMNSSINWYRANLPDPDTIKEADFWPSREARVDGVPTLLIWGEEEAVFTKDFLTIIPGYVDNLTISVIPQAGHTPSTERADLFNKTMRSFIENQ
ncbi:Alpha/beta hydrolase fold protein [marine gamma proteobacterium HTCC2143]|jgi:pimeloyl-ACP methyl ester carboxylesterase|uniref:Alpha/beta hydrolase fold protein n=1 Tax=marine gamma proteobacterium HTCC2143 TaxID=247633 RepID=A0YFT3_9GAMM|nr:Alpha/beta hydrolase fold protein [marine gamma proteobacterium HTCC2143]